MTKLSVLVLIGGIVWLMSRERAREHVEDVARDLSEGILALMLRMTSGFASDVPEPILREEQERRTRWR